MKEAEMPAKLEDGVAPLRRDPLRPVAHERPRRLGSFLASLGPWEGESAQALTARLREARDAGESPRSSAARDQLLGEQSSDPAL
jgi:hypothetical protein